MPIMKIELELLQAFRTVHVIIDTVAAKKIIPPQCLFLHQAHKNKKPEDIPNLNVFYLQVSVVFRTPNTCHYYPIPFSFLPNASED